MKTRSLLFVLFIAVLFSGCIVYSFYPLYTEKDLFPNDILTGEWEQEDDGSIWHFEHAKIQGEIASNNIDSTSYFLTINDEEGERADDARFSVHIIKLKDNFFLDFYIDDFIDDDKYEQLSDFHMVPIHTFAKLTVEGNKVIINWFDQAWLEELIDENKIRIHHEDNDEFILLTAKPDELQKFVTKYVNSEEAFKDGLEVVLTR